MSQFPPPDEQLNRAESQGRRLHIVHVTAEHAFSGGEVQVFLLMDGLRVRGHRNVLVCPPGSASDRKVADLGMERQTVGIRNNRDILAVIRLVAAFGRSGADLIHLHTWTATRIGGLAARIARKPAIATCRMERGSGRDWHARITYEWLVRRTVAVSSSVAGNLVAAGLRRNHLSVIRSAVDPLGLRPRMGREATRHMLETPRTALVLITVGSLVRRKGIDVLLDALASLQAAGELPLLWITGEGPERTRLTAQAESLGIASSMRFLGHRDDIGGLLAAADVFVMPSRSEGLGVASLEAMAAGRPVLATRVGGLQEAVVDGITGLLVPPEDPRALAGAIERLARDPSLRARFAESGPRRINEAYLPDPMVDAYERLYHKVLGR